MFKNITSEKMSNRFVWDQMKLLKDDGGYDVIKDDLPPSELNGDNKYLYLRSVESGGTGVLSYSRFKCAVATYHLSESYSWGDIEDAVVYKLKEDSKDFDKDKLRDIRESQNYDPDMAIPSEYVYSNRLSCIIDDYADYINSSLEGTPKEVENKELVVFIPNGEDNQLMVHIANEIVKGRSGITVHFYNDKDEDDMIYILYDFKGSISVAFPFLWIEDLGGSFAFKVPDGVAPMFPAVSVVAYELIGK